MSTARNQAETRAATAETPSSSMNIDQENSTAAMPDTALDDPEEEFMASRLLAALDIDDDSDDGMKAEGLEKVDGGEETPAARATASLCQRPGQAQEEESRQDEKQEIKGEAKNESVGALEVEKDTANALRQKHQDTARGSNHEGTRAVDLDETLSAIREEVLDHVRAKVAAALQKFDS